MNIIIHGNFLIEGDFYKQLGAALAAAKLFKDYTITLRVLEGTGPEHYAESWMRMNLQVVDKSYEDMIMEFFLKMLKELSNYGRQ